MIALTLTQPHACADRRPARAAAATWRHTAAARALELLGWRSAAVWAWRRALRRNAGDAELHLRLGETLGSLGRWDEAAHAFRHAARLRPRCEEACGNLALALARVGRGAAALEVLRRLAALHPQRAELHVLLGACLCRQRPAEAVRAFRAACAAEPVPLSTRFFLGEALLGVEAWSALVADLHHARGAALTPARVHTTCASESPRAAAPPLDMWKRVRHAAAHIARAVLAGAAGARRLAGGPLRLALLIAGHCLARAGHAPLAIRCFRKTQALRGQSRGPATVPVTVRVSPRHLPRVPRGATRWLAHRGPALS